MCPFEVATDRELYKNRYNAEMPFPAYCRRNISVEKEIPGVFAFVGSNGEENAPDWHHDDFLVKDEALPVAVNYYVENALFLLDYFKEQDD